MITGDEALEALRLANPAVDERQLPEHTLTPSVLLEDTARRMDMKTQETGLTKLEPGHPRRRSRLLVAAAAFAGVLLVLGVVALVAGGGAEPANPPATTAATTTAAPTTTVAPTTTAAPTTTSAPTTTVPSLSEAEAREIVDSAFAAFNAGDFDTWLLWRERGATPDPGSNTVQYILAVETRIEVQDCTYRGFSEFRLDERTLGHGFDCATTMTDRLLEAAGIELQAIYNWVIGTDPESSQGGSNEDGDVEGEFYDAYHTWLVANHPDVAASMYVVGGDDEGDILAASVPALLELVDEFVVQSDAYPLTEPVPPAWWYGGPLIDAGRRG